MTMSKITRNVTFSRIRCVKTAVVDKVPRLVEVPDIIVFQRVPTEARAEAIMKRAAKENPEVYGGALTLIEFGEESARYEMSLEDFIRYGEKVAAEDAPPGDATPEQSVPPADMAPATAPQGTSGSGLHVRDDDADF